MPQGQLAQVLRGLGEQQDARVLVGPGTVDDAGVVLLGEGEGLPAGSELAVVQTVDYFPPVVDDPYFYGAIAAANSLSDVYAMGGRPFSALNLAGFPKEFPSDWLAEIFRGGLETMRAGGAAVAGGHTVQSTDALFGYAVFGTVERARMTANSGARAGDAVYLTKPLGMGTLTTAGMRGELDFDALRPAAEQMATLNAAAAEAMVAAGARACTDVTGFGLTGHARNVAAASGVTIRLEAAALPLFPGALELSERGFNSGQAKRGRAALLDVVRVSKELDDALVRLAFDAETSGGLLIVVAERDAPALERELAARDQLVRRVGACLPRSDHLVELA